APGGTGLPEASVSFHAVRMGVLRLAVPVAVCTTVLVASVTVSVHVIAATTFDVRVVVPPAIFSDAGPIAGATKPVPINDFTAERIVGRALYAALPGQLVRSASR